MELRRLVVFKDAIHMEGGLLAVTPVTRVAVCAIVTNPLAGRSVDDLADLIPFGTELGELLVREALAPAISRSSPTARPQSSASPAT